MVEDLLDALKHIKRIAQSLESKVKDHALREQVGRIAGLADSALKKSGESQKEGGK